MTIEKKSSGFRKKNTAIRLKTTYFVDYSLQTNKLRYDRLIYMVNIYKLIRLSKSFYKKIGSIYCSILNDNVYFTSEGFNHLLYESYGRPRNVNERYMKLKCLPYAPQVIKKCTSISEVRKVKRRIKNKLKNATHYELIHEVHPGKKIRVIVEKIGNGKYRFMSVMPHDKKSKKRLAAPF